VTVLREGDKQIPIVARLRMEERAQLADVQNLYVYSMQGTQKAPLRQVSSVRYGMQTEKSAGGINSARSRCRVWPKPATCLPRL
jgi:multidrug efflux pump subunit AcrB